jgi:dTDP-glucose 4,6-dehydratase
VVGIDNLRTGAMANIAHLRDRDFEFIRHDVTRYIDVEGHVDYILHFRQPGEPGGLPGAADPDAEGGLARTHNALGSPRPKGAKFLLASPRGSTADPLVHPQDESYWGNVNPDRTGGVYDEAEAAREAIPLVLPPGYHGLDTAIVRIFNTYGPRMRLHDGRASRVHVAALRGRGL